MKAVVALLLSASGALAQSPAHGVDRVAESTILGSALAARGGFVVMTTAKQSYRAPVDCVELRPEAFDRLFSALDGR